MVEATLGSGRLPKRVRVLCEPPAAVLDDEHEVLETAAAEASDVERRLDGEHLAGDERRVQTAGEARLLVELEPDAVAERVREAAQRVGLLDAFDQRRPVSAPLEELAEPPRRPGRRVRTG